jgi:hypothetical protein
MSYFTIIFGKEDAASQFNFASNWGNKQIAALKMPSKTIAQANCAADVSNKTIMNMYRQLLIDKYVNSDKKELKTHKNALRSKLLTAKKKLAEKQTELSNFSSERRLLESARAEFEKAVIQLEKSINIA